MKRLKLFTTTILLLTLATTTHAQTWTQATKALANDGQSSDYLGWCVDIDGDYAIVGAEMEDQKASDAGAAYVFVRSGTSWTQQAKLTASDGALEDRFGSSVAINGNYAVVGALSDDIGGQLNSGSAYVFVRSGTSWSQQAKLTTSDAERSDNFGWSASIDGDYALIGAYRDDNSNGTYAGSAYVFVRSGTSWSQQAKLLASDGAANDYLGWDVDIDGDYALVGAYLDDNSLGTNAGAAYVFVRSGTSWSQQAKLTASDGAASDAFGSSTSISGETIVIGAYMEDDKGTNAGAVYAYKRSGTSWSQQSKITASDGAASDMFGYSVAISGDYALMGAYLEDDKGSNAGAAYFYGEPVCSSTSALPTTASTTYTGAYANTDANGWTHYCSTDDKLLLSLDTAGSGAVVAVGEVQLKLGASKTTSHGADGGMIKNTDGYLLLDRLWDVNPTTQPSGEVGVRYYFTNAEYNALVSAAGSHTNSSGASKPTTIAAVTAMEFYKTSGTAFAMPHTSSTGIVYTNGSSASTSNWLYAAKGSDHSAEFNVTSFSGGGGGAGAANASLPVELLAFTATQADQHTAMLRWTTATEINNNRFDIERSYDGRTFEVVGDVAGNGNSQHQIDYSYTDASVSKVQKTVYYRLKQVDFDGAYEYSDIRVVRFDAVGNDMQLVAYPNPMNNELNVMVGLTNGESYQLEVTNLQGKLVHQENHTYDNGIHKLNTSEWNSGMYIVRVATKHATKHMKVVKK